MSEGMQIIVFWVAWSAFAIWAVAYLVMHIRDSLRSAKGTKP